MLDFYDLLACPVCNTPLGPGLTCGPCARTFPVQDGRPILLRDPSLSPPKVNAVLDAQAAQRQGLRRSGLRGVADWIREATTASVFADDSVQVPMLVDRLQGTLPGNCIVEIGAGEQYYRRHLERLGRVIAADIAIYGATDLVADAHALPFRDGSVDALCVVEVLEHLERPWEFVREAHRVLKPRGVLFGVTPQYCPTHGFPHDFFRYTRGGLTSLAQHGGLVLEESWPLGGAWGTLLHWYWANHARENPLRRIPGISVGYHAWFHLVARVLDGLDERDGRGTRTLRQEHHDHVGHSFVMRKPPSP
jgi:SAM-dependent methyltransferase/uncharacterized protein YbaR (Trm112 family)